MAPKAGLDATWALGPTNFDSPLHFTPTLGGPDPLGAFAPYPNGQKGSKRAQNGPKWLKMTKKGLKSGSRRHGGSQIKPILPHELILVLKGHFNHFFVMIAHFFQRTGVVVHWSLLYVNSKFNHYRKKIVKMLF